MAQSRPAAAPSTSTSRATARRVVERVAQRDHGAEAVPHQRHRLAAGKALDEHREVRRLAHAIAAFGPRAAAMAAQVIT
jgi:hypothetical protein